jgi:hypothetical protein
MARTMEDNGNLPSMKSIFGTTRESSTDATTPMELTQVDASTRVPTPRENTPCNSEIYPSPASDLYDDVDMAEGWCEAIKKRKNNSGVATHLTPTIVHYKPNGVPTTRSQKASRIQKPTSSRRGSKAGIPGSSELKIKMVKWDRQSDKGTAPLNTEPRISGPRSCTLCALIKRKVHSMAT